MSNMRRPGLSSVPNSSTELSGVFVHRAAGQCAAIEMMAGVEWVINAEFLDSGLFLNFFFSLFDPCCDLSSHYYKKYLQRPFENGIRGA